MRKKLSFFFTTLSTLTFLFTGCEYDSDNVYYKDVEKPKEIEIGVDLAGAKSGDTLYVYNTTYFTYNIDTPDKYLLDFKCSIDGNAYTDIENKGSIGISPNDFIGKDILNMKFIVDVKPESASIANTLGLDRYKSESNFYIKIIRDAEFNLNVRQEKSSDGHLVLRWDDMNKNNLTVDKYEISYNDRLANEYKNIILNGNETSYTDMNYVYGYQTYTITAFYKENTIDKITREQYTVSYDAIQEKDIKIEELADGKVKVSWKADIFTSKVVIVVDDSLYKASSNDKSIILEHSQTLGTSNNNMHFYFLPVTESYENYKEYPRVSLSLTYPSIDFNNEPIKSLTVDTKNSRLYISSNNNSVLLYDAKTLSLKDRYTYNLSWTSQIAKIIYSDNPERIIFNHLNYIYALDTKNLGKILFEIQASSYYSDWDAANGKLITYSYYYEDVIKIYETTSGTLQHEIQMNENSGNIKLSDDGKYICFYNETKILIYQIDGQTPKLVYSQSNSSPTNDYICYFNPKNSDEVYLGNLNQFYKLTISSKTKSKDVRGELNNIDKKTGTIIYKDPLYKNNSLMHILSPDLNTILLTQKTYSVDKLYIADKYLLSTNGYRLYYRDISKFLK